MPAPDRDRVEKLLGMLGSEFDGEIANAARMIVRMAKAQGKGVAEFIFSFGGSGVERVRVVYREPPAREPPPRKDFGTRPEKPRFPQPIMDELNGMADNLGALDGVLTEWEWNFANDLAHRYRYDNQLSERQIETAERLIAKVNKHFGVT